MSKYFENISGYKEIISNQVVLKFCKFWLLIFFKLYRIRKSTKEQVLLKKLK